MSGSLGVSLGQLAFILCNLVFRSHSGCAGRLSGQVGLVSVDGSSGVTAAGATHPATGFRVAARNSAGPQPKGGRWSGPRKHEYTSTSSS